MSNINKRGCYCGTFSKEELARDGIPEGYCGICERCGKPGHTRHFPGPVPYTGAWCDRCVRIVAVMYWVRPLLFFVMLAAVIWFISQWIAR